MKDNRSIVITLKLDNGESNNNDTENQTSAKKKDDKDNVSKAVAVFAVAHLVQTAASESVAWGEYIWNRELTLKDDYIGQRNKSIATTQINRGISLISNVGTMTASGAAFGPVGAIIGAAVGAVSGIAGIVRSNLQGQEQQNITLTQMDAQLGFTRSRAGWSTQAASIGEDL